MSKRAVRRAPQRRRWRWLVVLLVIVGVLGVVALWLVIRSQQASDALTSARDGVSKIRTAIADGEPGEARELLPIVQADAARAADVTGDPVFAIASAVPLVGNTPNAVRTVSQAADDVAANVLPQLIDVSETLDPEAIRTDGDALNLQAFEDAAPLLENSTDTLAQVSTDLAGIDTAATPTRVSDAVTQFQTQVDETLNTTRSAARGAQLIPPMLGGDGKRNYFLAFQSNNEARGTGGFFGSYGLASADNGKVRIDKLASRSELDAQTYKSLPLDFGEEYDALYGDDPATWAGVNMSPHFPYAAQLWLKMWQDRTGERLDGVITTDPVTLSYLLEATGPVTLKDGRKITADNVVAFTESEIYALYPLDSVARDEYLQQITDAAFEAVLSGTADPQALVEALGKAAGERRLLIYSDHKDEQLTLADSSLGGVIPDDAAPFAGLATINGGGNKLDYYLGRGLDYQVLGCNEDGSRRTRITVRFDNSAPSSGLPLYVDARSDRPLAPDGTPRSGNGDHFFFAQVYATQGAALINAERGGKPQEVTQGVERGRPVFQIPVEISAGARAEITLDLVEPPTVGEPRTFVTPLVKPVSVTADETECGSG